MLPSTWVQVLVILVVVVPGFVYQIVRRRVRGPHPDERDVTIRILRAIASSAIFALIYAGILGPRLFDVGGARFELSAGNVRQIAWTGLLLVFVIPVVAAYVGFYVTTSKWWDARVADGAKLLEKRGLRGRWNPTPSAWDHAFASVTGHCWVRVLTVDGRWIGGYYGDKSFASSYPDPPTLFLERGFQIDQDGIFTSAVTAEDGIFIRCEDIRLVDFKKA
jgi:hypothetical protein